MKKLVAVLTTLVLAFGTTASAVRATPNQATSADWSLLPGWLATNPLGSASTGTPRSGSLDDDEVDEVRLSAEDDGRQIALKGDQVLVISLEGNPSTGYLWEIQEVDESILRQIGEATFEPESELLGAPGTQVFHFQPVGTGQTTLTLVYRRPWENVAPAKTFFVRVQCAGPFTNSDIPINPTPIPSSASSIESGSTGPVHDPSALRVPSAFNWCDTGGCTPVKDQGGCGSCWAFGTVGALESGISIHDGLVKDLSEQYLVSCNTDGWGCSGGWFAHDYHWWKIPPGESDAGAVYETDFPYTAADDPCNPPHSHYEKISSWDYVGYSVPPAADIKQAIYDYGPVSVAICAGPGFGGYSGGVFETDDASYCNGGVNHGVVLVGWDDNQGTNGIWHLKNSWGTGWGESGYMRIGYGISNVGYRANYIVYGAGADVGPLVYDGIIVDDDANGQSSGDGDGIVEPGETIELYIALHNQGSDTATSVNAALDTSDPYITWPWNYNTSSSYPDIVGGGSEFNADDFEFPVDPNTPPGHIIHFDLDITASNGGPWYSSFDIVVQQDATVSPIYVLWQDDSGGEDEIYVRRQWNGSVWEEVGAGSASGGGISDNGARSHFPSVAIARDGTPYVAWDDDSDGDWEIYVRRWNGSVWEEVGAGSASGGGISDNSDTSGEPWVTIARDGTPYVAWYDRSAGDEEIYVRRWNGSVWEEVGAGSASGGGISDNSGGSWYPAMAIALDGTPYVTWQDDSDGNYEVYVRRWNGSVWEEVGAGSASGGGISDDNGAWYPSVAIAPDGTVYVAWYVYVSGDTEIYVRRWNGSLWEEVGVGSASGGGISDNSGDSYASSVAIAPDGTPYIAWHDTSSGDREVYIRRWNGSAWEEVGAGSASGGGISDNTGKSYRPSMAIALDGTPYVVWQDDSGGEDEIYVRRWNGSVWEEVGAGSASGGGISDNSGASREPSVAIAVLGGQGSWTFLVYLDGDNNLEGAAIDDFLEMASVGSDSNVNIVAQMDRVPGYDNTFGDWTSTKRFLITPGMTPTSGNAVQDIGEANMGDPQTLVDFAQWGMSNYPADHYALVIWDHGSGWRLRPEEEPLLKDVAYDDTSGGDAIDMPELRSAMDVLSGGGADPLDLVGFDACLMGMIEVDDQLIPFVDVRVGSEETEPWDGWPYDGILSALTADPAMPPDQLGTIVVDEYYVSYGNGETQSAVDLGAAYSNLVSAVDDFAVALINGVPTYCSEMAGARSSTQEFYYPTYVDIYDFAHQIHQQVNDATIDAAAANVMNLLSTAVIQEQHGSSWPGAHGISIYFPESAGSYDTTYDGSQGWLQFTANTQWDEWLHAFYDCSTTCNDPYEPNDSRPDATPISYGDTLTDPDICPTGDVDYYVFSGSAGDVILADIDARSLSPASALDSYLYLLDSNGNELAHNDDSDGLDSRIEYILPADGTYYLRVEEYNHPNEGGPDYFYTISLTLASSFDVYSAYTSSPPSIDGHISAGEWSDAAAYDITTSAALVRFEGDDVDLDIIGPSGPPQLRPSRSPVTLYVMNDGSHLYLAFNNPNDVVHHDYDQIGIYFDDNPLPSDGQWTHTTCGHPDGEGNFWVRPSTHKFREIIAGPNYCSNVEPAPGVDGRLEFTSGHAQAETAIDLTSSALRASLGDSIGMRLWILDYDRDTQDGVWPIGAVWNDPSTYRFLTLAHPGNVGPLVYDSYIIDDDASGQSNGDGDGIVECGETIELYVALHNQGSDTATGVNAALDINDPYVTWPWTHNTDSPYPDIPGGGTEINTNDFDFPVDPNTPNGHIIHFDLDISADQGSWTDSFDVPVVCGDEVIVTIEDGNGSPGSTDNPVTISADNQSQTTTPIAAGEFRVVYDGSIGLDLVDVDTTARSTGFMVDWTKDQSKPLLVEAHILLYSLSDATIAPGTGPILELLFDVDPAAQAGDSSTFSFSQVQLADQQGYGIRVDFTDTGQFTIGCDKDGDINDDGDVNVLDLQTLIIIILHQPQPDPSLYPLDWWCRADLAPLPNGDDQWDIFDLQRLICIILGTCASGRGEEVGSRGENLVSIEEVYAIPGSNGAFDIGCDNADAVYAAEIRFTYDSTIGLNVSDVATAPRTDGWSVGFSKDESDPSAVEVHVLLYNLSGWWSVDPGTGALLSVVYEVDAEAAGDSQLDITQVNLSDAVGQPLPAKGEDGMFHVTEAYRLYLPLIIKNGSP